MSRPALRLKMTYPTKMILVDAHFAGGQTLPIGFYLPSDKEAEAEIDDVILLFTSFNPRITRTPVLYTHPSQKWKAL